MDSIPILSQCKSFAQWIAGDSKGAAQTQQNFSKRCPVVSQVRSLVHSISGDNRQARNVQLQFVKGMDEFADNVPVVGHIKGGIHYMVGDHKGGEKAMKAASRTTGVIGGGIVGGYLRGPTGAVTWGIAGGSFVDELTNAIDSKMHGEFRPSGYMAKMNEIEKKEEKDQDQSWNTFDLVLILGIFYLI